MSESYKEKLDNIVFNEIFSKKFPDPLELVSVLHGVQALSSKYQGLKSATAKTVEDYEFKVYHQNKPDSENLSQKSKTVEDLKQDNITVLKAIIEKCKNLPAAELEELKRLQKKIIELILSMYPEA